MPERAPSDVTSAAAVKESLIVFSSSVRRRASSLWQQPSASTCIDRCKALLSSYVKAFTRLRSEGASAHSGADVGQDAEVQPQKPTHMAEASALRGWPPSAAWVAVAMWC